MKGFGILDKKIYLGPFYKKKDGYGYGVSLEDKNYFVYFSEKKSSYDKYVSGLIRNNNHKTGEISVDGKKYFLTTISLDEKANLKELDKRGEFSELEKAFPYLTLWDLFPQKLNNLKLFSNFAFQFTVKDIFDTSHWVCQIQGNYIGSRREKLNIEILFFCTCATIDEKTIVQTLKDYITQREKKMKYKNLIREIDIDNKIVILSFSSSKILSKEGLEEIKKINWREKFESCLPQSTIKDI
jgi:hypothetical protein